MNRQPVALTQCKTLTTEEFEQKLSLYAQRYWLEPKIDGWRIQMEVDPDGVQSWTRTQHDASGKLPKSEGALRHAAKVANTNFRLDGEVVYLDEHGDPNFYFTSSCMGSGTDVCVDKQQMEHRWLTYVVFDILRVGDRDLRSQPYEQRRDLLFEVLPDDLPNVVKIAAGVPTMDLHIAYTNKYFEGSVLKDIRAPYAGKRHKSWLKMKADETLDVKIVGYKPGQGKYEGLIGAINFVAEDGTPGHCSGMDDDTRVWISDHRETLIGQIFEVKHFGRTPNSFRHPQFIRFRLD